MANVDLVWAILVLCYVPALITPYGFMDDYAILADSTQGGTATREIVIASRRPTYALLLELTFHHIHDIEDLQYVRLLSIISIAFLAWCLYRMLVLVGWSDVHSLLLSLTVVLMPAFQVYAAWATTAFHVWA